WRELAVCRLALVCGRRRDRGRMAPAQRTAGHGGSPQARAGQAEVAAEAPPERDRRVRRERREGPRPAADDRGLRPPQLADGERGAEAPRVRQRGSAILVVLRLLPIGGGEDERVAAAAQRADLHLGTVRAREVDDPPTAAIDGREQRRPGGGGG